MTEWGLQRGYDDPKKRSLAQTAMSQYQEHIGNRLTIIPGIHNVSIEDIMSIVEDLIEKTGNRPMVIVDYFLFHGAHAFIEPDPDFRRCVRENTEEQKDIPER